jgi:nitrogen fixation protein FixH
VSARPVTGRTVLGVALGAFGVILGVNALLAWFAVSTFSGLVVDNSYVASQDFDARRRAQEALGWTLAVAHEDGVLDLALTGPDGAPVRPDRLDVVVGRPATARDDRALALAPTPRGYVAAAPLGPGAWTVAVEAVAANGARFHRREPLRVADRP